MIHKGRNHQTERFDQIHPPAGKLWNILRCSLYIWYLYGKHTFWDGLFSIPSFRHHSRIGTKVLHRDLKPSNIFLTGRGSGFAHSINEEDFFCQVQAGSGVQLVWLFGMLCSFHPDRFFIVLPCPCYFWIQMLGMFECLLMIRWDVTRRFM